MQLQNRHFKIVLKNSLVIVFRNFFFHSSSLFRNFLFLHNKIVKARNLILYSILTHNFNNISLYLNYFLTYVFSYLLAQLLLRFVCVWDKFHSWKNIQFSQGLQKVLGFAPGWRINVRTKFSYFRVILVLGPKQS